MLGCAVVVVVVVSACGKRAHDEGWCGDAEKTQNRIFPELASRFLMSFGLAIIFDPIIILITDGATQYWSGDVFKLYNKFYLEDGSWVASWTPGLSRFVCELWW